MRILFHLGNEESFALECMKPQKGLASPLCTPLGEAGWGVLLKTEEYENKLGYSDMKGVVRVFGSSKLERGRLCRKNQSSFSLCLRLLENIPRRLSSFVSERSSSVIVASDTT